MKLILASGSPRRTQLLTQIGLEHRVMISHCEEKITKTIPSEIVMELAEQKADSVYGRYVKEHTDMEFVVLGADTIVAQDGKILGKPKNEAEAYDMIQSLQGRTHQVYTGVALLGRSGGVDTRKVFYECSQVHVYPMTAEEIRAYVRTGEPMDKAGGYGIQGRFAAFVESIEGDYNTIVGLPVARVYQELTK